VKNIQSEYILAKTVETILNSYAKNEMVQEMKEQMKHMPTMSSLELRLQKVS